MLKTIPDLSEKNITAEGIVIFLLSNPGSKSEIPLPYLRSDGEKDIRLLLKDDNPFENAGIRPYEGKKVRVRGDRNAKGVLIANEIELVAEDDAGNSQEETKEPTSDCADPKENPVNMPESGSESSAPDETHGDGISDDSQGSTPT